MLQTPTASALKERLWMWSRNVDECIYGGHTWYRWIRSRRRWLVSRGAESECSPISRRLVRTGSRSYSCTRRIASACWWRSSRRSSHTRTTLLPTLLPFTRLGVPLHATLNSVRYSLCLSTFDCCYFWLLTDAFDCHEMGYSRFKCSPSCSFLLNANP